MLYWVLLRQGQSLSEGRYSSSVARIGCSEQGEARRSRPMSFAPQRIQRGLAMEPACELWSGRRGELPATGRGIDVLGQTLKIDCTLVL
jgi:hypothetical protein